jgi:hypothetical protein
MKTLTLFALLIYPVSALAQWDFQMDSLSVVWRAKAHPGPPHCTASANLAATDTSLIVEVHVIDDHLVFTDDPLNSDHIELWFALPRLYGDVELDDNFIATSPTCYYADGSSFYVCRGENSLRTFQREIRSPEIEASNYSVDSFSYDQLDTKRESWLKSAIDEYLADARSPSLRKTYAFFGMIHLGIFPQSNRAFLYEKEAYSIIANQIGVQLPDYSRFVKVESHVGKNEYTAKIVLPPEAFGFISRSGLEALMFLIDVVDTDSLGKQATLMSTSRNRKWGVPETFNRVDFDGGVHVTLLPEYKEFGRPYTYGGVGPTVGSKLLDALSHVFLFTSKGWLPVQRECIPFDVSEPPSAFALPNIQKCVFKLGRLSYRQEMVGKNKLGYLRATGGEYLIINDADIRPNDEVVLNFLLPDSSVGLITAKCEIGGMYNKSQTSRLCLVANAAETPIADFQEWDTVSVRLLGNHIVNESDWDRSKLYWNSDEEEAFDWSHLLIWDKPGESLVLDFGNGQRFRISWNRHGQNVKLFKL